MRSKPDTSRRFAQSLERLGVTPKTPIVAALSGGPDSTALLALLLRWGGRSNEQIAAAHFNHQLRSEAGAEAKLVEEHCANTGIQLEIGVGQVSEFAQATGRSLHDAARRLR